MQAGKGWDCCIVPKQDSWMPIRDGGIPQLPLPLQFAADLFFRGTELPQAAPSAGGKQLGAGEVARRRQHFVLQERAPVVHFHYRVKY